MSSEILKNRLKKEIMNLDRDPPPGVSCYPKEDDLTDLEAYIKGPPDSPYETGLFKLQVKIPQNYPFDPPQIRFMTFIYHPNIDDAGRICADILKKGEKGGWNPALNLSTTLLLLSQLLAQPNPDDPLDADIAKEYQLDYPTFKQKAIEYTAKFANKELVLAQDYDKQPDTVEQHAIVEYTEMIMEEESKKSKVSLSLSKKRSPSFTLSSQSSSSQLSSADLSKPIDVTKKQCQPVKSELKLPVENKLPVQNNNFVDLTENQCSTDISHKIQSQHITDMSKKTESKYSADLPKKNETILIEKSNTLLNKKTIQVDKVINLDEDINNNTQEKKDLKRVFDESLFQDEVIILSDDDTIATEGDVMFTLQLSRKKHRKKLSLQKSRKA